MKNKKTAFIILAAGKGKRIKTEIDKVLLPVAGLPMIQHILRTIEHSFSFFGLNKISAEPGKFDQSLENDSRISVSVVVSILKASFVFNDKIIGFDAGPGNYLIDKWVKTSKKMEFDDMGLLAKSGKLNELILKKFLSNPYYKKKAPKSLDVKDFNLNELKKLSLEDGCTTLSMLTVQSICMAINNFTKPPNKILFSGGGRKNEFIIDSIKKILDITIQLIDEFDFNGDFIESQAFGYLAIRSYLNKFITFPSTTGVKKSCLGGSVFKI